MAVEKKDETQEKTEETQKEEKSEKFELSEENEIFDERNLEKALQDIESEEDKPIAEGAEEKKETEEKAAPEKKEVEKQAGEKKPFKILKRKGEEIPVYSEEEYDELASKGLDYTKKTTGVARREDEVKQVGSKIDKLVQGLQSGEFEIVRTADKKKEEEEYEEQYGDLDEDTREALKKRDDRIAELELKVDNVNQKSEQVDNVMKEEQKKVMKAELDGMFVKVREEHPFDEIKDGERNVTQDIFVGLATKKFNEDRIKKEIDPEFVKRDYVQIFNEVAKDLVFVKNHYSGAGTELEDGSSVTSDALISKYPDQVKEIQVAAVDAHIDAQNDSPTSIRSTTREARPGEKKEEKVTSVEDGIAKAYKDETLTAGLEELSKSMGLPE